MRLQNSCLKFMYKLTIAHGTYENDEKFEQTLLSIIPQIKNNKSVQFLILDDSTSDKTFKIVKKYKL